MKTYLTEEGVEVSGNGLEHLRPHRKEKTMTQEPWHKHTPGDPMPCKCGDSVVEVEPKGYPSKTFASLAEARGRIIMENRK